MDPLGSTTGGLEGPPSLGAEQTFGLDAQSAGSTQPVPLGYLQDAIARLPQGERGRKVSRGDDMKKTDKETLRNLHMLTNITKYCAFEVLVGRICHLQT